ncbi:hypothetical protein [Moorena sp. SIO4G3]|uniref:hypothetical protein n=1 Tax=Moorena sp. SIO4G3 TaxID=2607821 RepID=UPI00142ADCA7|nr:hypothetical protein [Moorena sp. SIO4G3]NEO79373.1 hypothetical protein [Moorena sp. SIO4G3]
MQALSYKDYREFTNQLLGNAIAPNLTQVSENATAIAKIILTLAPIVQKPSQTPFRYTPITNLFDKLPYKEHLLNQGDLV